MCGACAARVLCMVRTVRVLWLLCLCHFFWQVFGFVHETISVLSPHYPDIALRLFLQVQRVTWMHISFELSMRIVKENVTIGRKHC